MSRPIKLTQELIDECRQDFEKALSLTKLSDGKLSFKLNIEHMWWRNR